MICGDEDGEWSGKNLVRIDGNHIVHLILFFYFLSVGHLAVFGLFIRGGFLFFSLSLCLCERISFSIDIVGCRSPVGHILIWN